MQWVFQLCQILVSKRSPLSIVDPPLEWLILYLLHIWQKVLIFKQIIIHAKPKNLSVTHLQVSIYRGAQNKHQDRLELKEKLRYAHQKNQINISVKCHEVLRSEFGHQNRPSKYLPEEKSMKNLKTLRINLKIQM